MDDLKKILSKFDRLSIRAAILQAVRDFFNDQDFLEVSTPLVSTDLIPEEHIDPIRSDAGFLLPSPEINMKKMLAAGYKRIFQIGPCFRKGEKGAHHLPEFTLLEWYRAGDDYHALADDCEGLLLKIAEKLLQNNVVHYQGEAIDLKRPWPRTTVQQAFLSYAGWDPLEQQNSVKFEYDFAEKIMPALDRNKPLFLLDFPDYEASLAKKKEDDFRLAERLELFIGGLELANGFSELVDSEEQRRRFEEANRKRTALGKKAYPIPEDFLRCLPLIPPSAGIALGLDRLAMLFTNASHIEQVVPLYHP